MFYYFVYHINDIAGAFESKERAYALALLNANNGYWCTIEDQFGTILFDTSKPFN